ncbi:phytanoyl-CoA dioxygenase family protein [Methylobacterium radiotolerans]|jgi:ectoine hydroxylase-related dioxygenase (phytanoyl-CoA dioxygenase family)|uniref:phytanoyl-CoA dioxygenase family protein n=1 Tax=Methylobacterium TaxID=407 RepID=UPI0005E17C03|nr:MULTISPECIES: phytanoyl-CoA dioxygenase family protein [Methylobacterium]MBN6822512.1 phytanoyl-CoA dioxygenase family protein [Methylobacterium organophilum]OXE40035.1 phytanoyl-CoA dioxygenase [Methylobacterium radiotolerans]GAN47810.1 phytanoyl-CoA dioxygenase [Methylobacterium sp. ME121]
MTQGLSRVADLARTVKTTVRNLTLGRDDALPVAPEPPRGPPYVVDADVPVDIGCIKVFRAESFPESGPSPWLDQPDAAEIIERRVARRDITPKQAEICRYWEEHGYYVLRGAIDSDTIDEAWGAYEAAIARGDLTLAPEKAAPDDPHPGRYLNPHLKVEELDRLLKHPVLMNFSSMVLGRPAIPFQTIASHKGSQQSEHSDSIHMTTYPLGYLAACWVAMEDIHADAGPLVYYPGTHRLPYLFSHDVGISTDDFRERGYGAYVDRYEPAIKQEIREHGATPAYFTARKGDVLFWHANLLHGGSARADMQRSRKALVHHYFAEGCVCYHDLSATTSAVHGPVESLPTCGASSPDIAIRGKIAS